MLPILKYRNNGLPPSSLIFLRPPHFSVLFYSKSLRIIHIHCLLVPSFNPLWNPIQQSFQVHNCPKLVSSRSPVMPEISKGWIIVNSVLILPCHQWGSIHHSLLSDLQTLFILTATTPVSPESPPSRRAILGSFCVPNSQLQMTVSLRTVIFHLNSLHSTSGSMHYPQTSKHTVTKSILPSQTFP